MHVFTYMAICYYSALNVLLFMIFGYDKFQARRAGSRIPESSLLLLGSLGGMVGGLIAMGLFQHKTRKIYFTLCYVLALLLHVAAILALLYLRHKGGASL